MTTTHHIDVSQLSRLRGIYYRCYDQRSPDYADYGGRGITLAANIEDLTAFTRYVSSLPNFGVAGLSLDRINNDKGYEIGNLRWATAQQQTDNRRCSTQPPLSPFIVGDVYGTLTVTGVGLFSRNGAALLRMSCTCGKQLLRSKSALVRSIRCGRPVTCASCSHKTAGYVPSQQPPEGTTPTATYAQRMAATLQHGRAELGTVAASAVPGNIPTISFGDSLRLVRYIQSGDVFYGFRIMSADRIKVRGKSDTRLLTECVTCGNLVKQPPVRLIGGRPVNCLVCFNNKQRARAVAVAVVSAAAVAAESDAASTAADAAAAIAEAASIDAAKDSETADTLAASSALAAAKAASAASAAVALARSSALAAAVAKAKAATVAAARQELSSRTAPIPQG